MRYFSYCLILLSLADLLTTYILLQTSHRFYEGNPIANFFFHRWNILGMTLFKFSLVAIVIVVSEIVERFRPGLGKLLLTLACAASAYVVVYGIELFFEHAI
ncbi:hypothetical protein KIH39_09950 [Telmatocola sphagniphila]|uniref:DUF5658 domain-containing protein n=1 Tax=Telmatocola sphagniphila TaxID=1123043 RepID=A0A8E6BAM3_9BACT|nr:DUF5658 family protein [Telmatocola sphagniphila]QVL34206.1 hypothetical protein KIH39_09950 [Telmatocola sphagniphila]